MRYRYLGSSALNGKMQSLFSSISALAIPVLDVSRAMCFNLSWLIFGPSDLKNRAHFVLTRSKHLDDSGLQSKALLKNSILQSINFNT